MRNGQTDLGRDDHGGRAVVRETFPQNTATALFPLSTTPDGQQDKKPGLIYKDDIQAASIKILDATELYDPASDSRLVRFIALSERTLADLVECLQLLDSGEIFAADTKFMDVKDNLTELFMFRDLGESLGLIVLSCLDVALSLSVASDGIQEIRRMRLALDKIRKRPFMDYREARKLAKEVRASLNVQPAYISMIAELLLEGDNGGK